MPNPHPNTSGLKKSKWKHTPTRSIRVPEAFADELLEIAHFLDLGGTIEQNELSYPAVTKAMTNLVIENSRLEASIQSIVDADTEEKQRILRHLKRKGKQLP